MNGAESLVQTAERAGVRICFGNPGTTELPLVRALDAAPAIRPVLGLFEGVCTGAADAWGRLREEPALVLLHTGPGLANGIANLHNAARAGSPVLVVVGDHATWHRGFDPPLAADVEALAGAVSHSVRVCRSAGALAADFAHALADARTAPGRVTTLIAPADCQWGEAAGPAVVPSTPAPARVASDTIERVAKRLRAARAPGLFLGAAGLREAPLRQAGRIAAATGARLLCASFPARVERGPDLPFVERLPYFPADASRSVAALTDIVLAGAPEPVTFFGYPDVPSRVAPETCARHALAAAEDNVGAALRDLAEALDAPTAPQLPTRPAMARPEGALDPVRLAAAVAACQPEAAIVVDEALTSGIAHWTAAVGAPRHTHLCLTGGAIGQGPPCATGAALASPSRRVLDLQADGSAMYTLQALWTQARHGLDVTTVICANRSYRILELELELERSGHTAPEAESASRAFTTLDGPPLDWCALARGHGVPACRVERAEELTRELDRAFSEPGPRLIEALL